MTIPHLLLTLLVVIVWGINFLFVKVGLEEIPPLLLCAVRFILASVPAVFFIKPPAHSFKIVIIYGCVMFALQFSLMFAGIHAGMTAGMASLIAQIQVFFSIFFAVVLLGEKPHVWQIIGALISFMGIGVVALHFDASVTLSGFVLILAAAATWGFGNLITKKASNLNMMTVVVWGSFVASFPMIILSLLIEGPTQIIQSYHHLTWLGITAVVYIVYASTWIGYGSWNWLLRHYPVAMVVPFTLLVPIVGILSSILVLGEPFQIWKLVAGLFVLTGLGINLLGSRLFLPKLQLELAD